MPFKLFCLVLLISCASHTAHSAGVRNLTSTNEASQGLLGTGSFEIVTIEKVTLSYNYGVPTTTLTFCSDKDLIGTNESIKDDIIVLIYETFDGNDIIEVDIKGEIDGNTKCAVFLENSIATLANERTTYTIHFTTVTALLNVEVDKSGSASFAMTVTANTVTCGVTPTYFIRAARENTKSTVAGCSQLSDNELICYKQGALSDGTGLCFTQTDASPDELIICIAGESAISTSEGTQLQVDHLRYGEDLTPGILSLTIPDATSSFEAIVQKDGVPLAACNVETALGPTGDCTISDFDPSSSTYTVCSVLLPDVVKSSEFQTSVSSITDMDVNAYEDTDNNLLQFRFANTNLPDMTYKATLYVADDELSVGPVSLDCTAIGGGSTCYGFLHISDPQTPVAYEYLEIDYDSSMNKIRYPYPPTALIANIPSK